MVKLINCEKALVRNVSVKQAGDAGQHVSLKHRMEPVTPLWDKATLTPPAPSAAPTGLARSSEVEMAHGVFSDAQS